MKIVTKWPNFDFLRSEKTHIQAIFTTFAADFRKKRLYSLVELPLGFATCQRKNST